MRTPTRRPGPAAAVVVLALTLGQLVVATAASDLPQFQGKGFAARLGAYPVLMLAVPLVWAWTRRRRDAPCGPRPGRGSCW